MSTKRSKAAVMEKILSLGLVEDRKQLYKKRGGKGRRKSRRGQDDSDEGLYCYYCKTPENVYTCDPKLLL